MRTYSQQLSKGLEIELQDDTTRRFVVGDRENVLETLRALGLPTG
ncbi:MULTISPECIES: hypothetical protein [unclassified Kocuria]|nr:MULTISPECIES: hypothetical protein [unclassified Kocuria]